MWKRGKRDGSLFHETRKGVNVKSKSVLKGEKKYYLADLSIYYLQNTDNRINYGPVLENVISNKDTEEREYRPFYMIKELYPRYLFTMDMLLQKRDGVSHVNIVDFIYNNKNL